MTSEPMNRASRAVAMGNAEHMRDVAAFLESEGAERLASLADVTGTLEGTFEDVPELGIGEYGLEVLEPSKGVHRVAVTHGDRRVEVHHGDTALAEATSRMLAFNAKRITEADVLVEPKVHPGDIVTIHKGLRRYEVLHVRLDTWMSGERCDYARVAPCDPGDSRPSVWVAMDMCHKVAPVATLHTVDVNGFMVTDELISLGHHVATMDERRRVVFIPLAGGVTDVMLVHPEYPRGHGWGTGQEPVATLHPGDSVLIERPSGNFVYRWMPDLGSGDCRLGVIIS